MAIEYLDGSRIIGLSTDAKPTDIVSGSEFIETDTGSRYIHNGTAWIQDTFESMRESLGSSVGGKKGQHFVEWFTGAALRTDTWNLGNSHAGYTIEMDDSVNGGLKLINNAVHTETAVIDFDDIRQYNQTANAVVSVFKSAPTSGGVMVGLGEDWENQNNYDSATMQVDAGYAGMAVQTLSSDGTSQTTTATGFSADANYHVYKLECTSTALNPTIDGVTRTTKTTNRPTVKMQPVIKAYSYSGNTTQLNINYYEAYNT
jgi:hypothetical protein|tara:strand:- start:165 stop:941 length:777 start_codon:yes stop_codon:yes gene_type:complete